MLGSGTGIIAADNHDMRAGDARGNSDFDRPERSAAIGDGIAGNVYGEAIVVYRNTFTDTKRCPINNNLAADGAIIGADGSGWNQHSEGGNKQYLWPVYGWSDRVKVSQKNIVTASGDILLVSSAGESCRHRKCGLKSSVGVKFCYLDLLING